MAIDWDEMLPETRSFALEIFGRPQVGIAPEQPKRQPAKQRGVPNSLEVDFARHCKIKLEYESITFHLAGNCKYTPDWAAVHDGRLIMIEVKGDSRNPTIQSRYAASMAKLRIAANRYPTITWYLAKKEGGLWDLYPVTLTCIKRKPVAVEWLQEGIP